MPAVVKQAHKITLILLAGLGAIALAVAAYHWTADEVAPTDADRALLLRPADLVPYFEDWTPKAGAETITKTAYIDGKVELVLEYDTDDEDEHLHMRIDVTHDTNAVEARLTFESEWEGSKEALEAADDELELREVTDLFSIGDKSRIGFMTFDEYRSGMLLVIRKGNNVYCLIIGGFYIDDPEVLKSLFLPRMALLAQFG